MRNLIFQTNSNQQQKKCCKKIKVLGGDYIFLGLLFVVRSIHRRSASFIMHLFSSYLFICDCFGVLYVLRLPELILNDSIINSIRMCITFLCLCIYFFLGSCFHVYFAKSCYRSVVATTSGGRRAAGDGDFGKCIYADLAMLSCQEKAGGRRWIYK